jgi:uncharacterized repeat protein (TIGR01451 family)
MKLKYSIFGGRLAVAAFGMAAVFTAIQVSAQSGATIISLAAHDLAYSDVTQRVYASNTNSTTLTPVSAIDGTVGTPMTISNLSARVCASDGGSYIFAALNGTNGNTNHICQFDVNAQSVVNAWTMDGTYVDDMAPVLGSPAGVAVTRKVLNRSPRFAGVFIYDNGAARSNAYTPFLGSNVIEPSRSPNRMYGYNNETSPASSQIFQVDATGIKQVGGWGTLQGFGVDISWRAGWIFATTGQIFDPDRGIQVGSFSNTPVSDDAASGRYYLALAGGIVAYDQNTLLPVGVTLMSGVTGVAGSFIKCGTNGFAIRVNSSKIALMRSPLVSSGPPADLNLSVALPSLPVLSGSPLSYTLTISNAGPNDARNVVLTQTLPGNATFVSATSTLGSNSLQSGGLVSSPLAIPAGSAVNVTVNLQTLKMGLLASVASVTSDSLDPNLSNNVVHLEMPVQTPLARNSVTEMSLQTTDLVWDKVSGRIFCSIPNANWLLGNSIAAFDPMSGIFDPRVATAIEPAKVAVSDDGQYLYAGINNDNSIQRINLSSRLVDLKFPTGLNYVADMAVLPGSPHAVAVTAHTTFAVYDDGTRRPNTVAPGAYNFQYYLALSGTNTLAYEGMPDGLRTIAIDSSGATAIGSPGPINSFDDQIKFDSGRLFTAGGRVIDPSSQTVITNVPYSGLVCPDLKKGKVFYLVVSGSAGTLHVFNASNFVELGSISITNISGSASSLTRWGADGLAFRTTGNQIFLVRTIFADDSDNNGLADSWEMANFGYIGVDPNADADHDGMSNFAEFIAGTDPNNPNSVLRITGIKSQTGAALLNWQGGTNVTYYLQRSPKLGTGAVWQDILTNPPSTSTVGGFTDLTASNSANYYRIRVSTH